MDDALARNEATATRLIWVPAAVLGAASGLLVLVIVTLLGSPVVGILLGLVWAGALTFGAARAARGGFRSRALAAVGAHPVTEADEPRLHNLVEGLCVGIGLEPPRLHVLEVEAANALAVAASVDDADLVVTRGLLDRLSRVEMEAVLAHELARIRRGDAIVGALAGTALRTPVTGPIARATIGRGEPVEAWTDLAAVDITRYPPALASALRKLGDEDPPETDPSVAHLWIHGAWVEGSVEQALIRVYEPAPPVGPRIEVLEEL